MTDQLNKLSEMINGYYKTRNPNIIVDKLLITRIKNNETGLNRAFENGRN